MQNYLKNMGLFSDLYTAEWVVPTSNSHMKIFNKSIVIMSAIFLFMSSLKWLDAVLN